jgi:hypothetical protein
MDLLPPLLFFILQTPIPRIVSAGIIFAFPYIYKQYLHHIQSTVSWLFTVSAGGLSGIITYSQDWVLEILVNGY